MCQQRTDAISFTLPVISALTDAITTYVEDDA